MTALARRVWVEHVMGMPVSVHLKGADLSSSDTETAVAQCFSHLRKVDDVFSLWREDSEISRVHRGELEVAAAHPWMAEVLELCGEAERRTAGLFTSALPSDGGVRRFDPTGLVKGWAVARAARYLALLPTTAHCINAGGDITAGLGPGLARAAVPPWGIGIEDPRDRTRVARRVELRVGAVATSGSAARGPHIIDPTTGALVDRDGSATVVGPDLVWADVWATAAFIDPVGAADLMALEDPDYELITL